MSDRVAAARSFMAGHARVLDRRRFELLFDGGDAGPVLAALGAFRNSDGGYGHGLEPDLRAPESQPAAALHAFQVFAEVAPVTAPEATELCDWLDAVSLPGGGLPFALPIEDARACAPFWAQADSRAFSLQITSIVAARANRVAAHDPAVARHPWLARATKRCLAAIDALEAAPAAYELAFAVRFLDSVHDLTDAAPRLLARLGERPSSGMYPAAVFALLAGYEPLEIGCDRGLVDDGPRGPTGLGSEVERPSRRPRRWSGAATRRCTPSRSCATTRYASETAQ